MLDLIYPPRCVFCHDFVANGKILVCDSCRDSLPRTVDCGRRKAPFVSSAIAPFYYEKDVRESLHRYKFSGCTGYAKGYAPYVAELIRQEYADQFDVLSWVPISRKRLKARGYDQSLLLAKAVGKLLGVRPIRTLKKIRDTAPQSLTGSAEKRKSNIAGAYTACSPERFAGKRVLLLDDIITTGSTISECARTLGVAGSDRVICAAIACSRR